VKRSAYLTVVLLVVVLPLSVTGCIGWEAPYLNPPATFQDSDLVGTWEARYWEAGVDTLIIRADGTFKQIYRDNYKKDYVYETPWNRWWVERFPDGRVRVHFEGGRYFLGFTERGEVFYDPFADELVKMPGELILNVRKLSSGELILHHMWTHSDRGFGLIGGETEMFRRVETP